MEATGEEGKAGYAKGGMESAGSGWRYVRALAAYPNSQVLLCNKPCVTPLDLIY